LHGLSPVITKSALGKTNFVFFAFTGSIAGYVCYRYYQQQEFGQVPSGFLEYLFSGKHSYQFTKLSYFFLNPFLKPYLLLHKINRLEKIAN